MELKKAIEIIGDICDKCDCEECPLHEYFGENMCKFDSWYNVDVDKLESILIKWADRRIHGLQKG